MFKVVIVGTGNIAPKHIDAYLEFKDKCEIVALVDIYEEKAIAMNEKYNLGANTFDSCDALLASGLEFDMVNVCTPPYTHAEIAISMMKNGKDVLVEKPMASSLEECDEMIKVMNETNQRMSIISQNRWQTPIYNLKKLVETNKAGRIIHAQVDSFWWRSINYYDLWWRGTWEKEGGGCTLNHAVHHIDLLNWIKGAPKEIIAIIDNLNHNNSEVEDFSVVISKYDDGSRSTLTSSLVHHGEDQKIVLQCEKAKIASPWDVYASKGKKNGFYEKDDEYIKVLNDTYKSFEPLEYTKHTAQILDFITALDEKRDFLVTAEQARNTIEFITAVYKSGFEKRTISLPIENNDPWYTTEGILDNVKNFYEKTTSIENIEDGEITLGKEH